jgi:opacity protein-like surface antigen
MKKFLLAVIILLGISTVASAQTNKGTWLLGGAAGYSNQSSSSSWSISPNMGYFIKDNLAIGGIINVEGDSYTSSYDGSTSSSTSTSIGAYVKPYFGGTEKNKWFAIGGIGTQSSGSQSKFAYAFGLGNASFLNQSIALELSGNYSKIAEATEGQFNLKVGFQIHFGGK